MGEACETDFTTEVHSPLKQPLAQTARYEPTSMADSLRRKLNTYSQWNSKKSSLQLATAGFIYTGITDKVECQSCGIRLYNWQEDEDPLQAHKKYAPDCEFMLTNFPNVMAPPKPKKILTVKYPHYSDYETRLRSFDSWPLKCVAQKPEMMARSGFFYIGSADRARCFHCGVTLRDWDTDDYPPCAHRQWSENCPYVQQIDVDGMKKEIEEWERDEKLRVEFENSTFIDCSSSVTLRDWDTDDYPPCAHRHWSENCPYVQQIDVDGMKKETEEWERFMDGFEISTFIDRSSSSNRIETFGLDLDNDVNQEGASAETSISCRSVPVEGNDVSLRQTIKLDSNVQRQEDITMYVTSGQRLEFTWRGLNNAVERVVNVVAVK